jgi:hypothetical protein
MFENFEVTQQKEFVDVESPTNFTFPEFGVGEFTLTPLRKRSSAVQKFTLITPKGEMDLALVKQEIPFYDGQCDYNVVEIHFLEPFHSDTSYSRVAIYHSDRDVLRSIAQLYFRILNGD